MTYNQEKYRYMNDVILCLFFIFLVNSEFVSVCVCVYEPRGSMNPGNIQFLLIVNNVEFLILRFKTLPELIFILYISPKSQHLLA